MEKMRVVFGDEKLCFAVDGRLDETIVLAIRPLGEVLKLSGLITIIPCRRRSKSERWSPNQDDLQNKTPGE